MRGPDRLSNREARWLALAAQGLAIPRPAAAKRPGVARLRRLVDELGTIQLDAVNVVARTQFLVPFSRVGAYDPAHLRSLTGPGAPWFEYWGHAASLMSTDLYPLFRPSMKLRSADQVESAAAGRRRAAWRNEHADYLRAVLRDVTENGPLTAGQLSDPRRRDGEWWDRRSDGRRAMEVLFGDGELAAWRSAGFERVYDLTERVIPTEALARPVPTIEEAQRELIVIAARCLGVATAPDLADYFWIRPKPAALRVAELVEDGRLLPASVEGWNKPAYVTPGARLRAPKRAHATLLSPFDSLVWNRDRTMRLFGFHYRIEIYVPEHLRTYGYYVLPLLVGDELVARFSLKADRRGGTLRVSGSYLEPGTSRDTVAEAAASELAGLGSWLGLESIEVAAHGNLADALAKAVPRG